VRWAVDRLPACHPLEGAEGVRIAPRSYRRSFLPFAITSDCDYPEIALRWADGLYDRETTLRAVEGVPGEHWRWAEAGEMGLNGKPAIWTRLITYGATQNFCWRGSGPFCFTEELHSGQILDPATADHNQEASIPLDDERTCLSPAGRLGAAALYSRGTGQL